MINSNADDFVDFAPNPSFGAHRIPHRSTLSRECIAMMSEWVNTCKATHELCRIDHSPWLPSRLLEVGQDGNVIRLVETRSYDVRGPYAALSHMWGDMSREPPLRTLVSNYEDMKAGIASTNLPRNFQDAMTTAHFLGIQYVWIDSLCIIQDLSSDWEKEAATMHQVYKYAHLTIVA